MSKQLTRETFGLVALIFSLALIACGGATNEVGRTVAAEVPRPPVELALMTPDRTWIDVGELRGAPVVLFVFATFDGTSQAMLSDLRRFRLRHPEVPMIGIAAQPDPSNLLDAYRHALHPPFTSTFDPEDSVASGMSALGDIPEIPTLIVLDERGVERARHSGYLSWQHLEELVERAGSGDAEPTPEAVGTSG